MPAKTVLRPTAQELKALACLPLQIGRPFVIMTRKGGQANLAEVFNGLTDAGITPYTVFEIDADEAGTPPPVANASVVLDLTRELRSFDPGFAGSLRTDITNAGFGILAKGGKVAERVRAQALQLGHTAVFVRDLWLLVPTGEDNAELRRALRAIQTDGMADFREEIRLDEIVTHCPAGSMLSMRGRVFNRSAQVWHRYIDSAERIRIGARLTRTDGKKVLREFRGVLAAGREMAPGESADFRLEVDTNGFPLGSYSLQFDLVFEHLFWFGMQGGSPTEVTLDLSSPEEYVTRSVVNGRSYVGQFRHLLHELRTTEIRAMPQGAETVVSAGCSDLSYFSWFEKQYPGIKRHIGVEYYRPQPEQLPPHIEWVRNTVSDLHDITDSCADLVFSGQNIEHLWPDEVASFLLESYRVLKPGGWLVLDSPNRDVTSRYGWSHWGHTIELTVAEIRELLQMAGFKTESVRGLWICIDPFTDAKLPLDHLTHFDGWPFLRRISVANAHPERSFIWWAEARKSGGTPDAERLHRRMREMFERAWPERINRLTSVIGEEHKEGDDRVFSSRAGVAGSLLSGPSMVLRPGRYEADLHIRLDDYRTESDLNLGSVSIIAAATDRADGRIFHRPLLAADVTSGEWRKCTLAFALDETRFSVQFRIISSGIAALSARAAIDLRPL